MAYEEDPTQQMGPGMMDEGMAAGAPTDAAGAAPPAPPPEAGAPPAEPDQEQQGDAGESSLFLTPDMLPPDMKVNAGDILEFKVVNPSDPDGHIEVVYNQGEDKEKGASWEDDFRNEMSARTPQTQAE
jgi:hypothetical protein